MSLTPLEEEVASLLQMNDTVNGTPGVKKSGRNDFAENADAVDVGTHLVPKLLALQLTLLWAEWLSISVQC